VSSSGETSATPINPNAQGPPPPGYSITGPAFDISTTATYTGPVTICFKMSSVTDPDAFANLRVLHSENGILVDRTSSHDFSTKIVCATTPTLSPFVVATLTTPQDIKQTVLNQLIALRAAITDKHDHEEFDDAIKSLSDSLNPALWIDGLHLQPRTGDRDFDEEKQAAIRLLHLASHSSTSNAQLFTLIAQITNADRQLAQVAINDAIVANGNAKEIDQANKQLAEGDKDAASGKPESIDDYREAWKHAIKALGTGRN
jgi:hypothetical protein